MRRAKSFAEIEEQAAALPRKPVVALANAQDAYALRALAMARRAGAVEGVLIGDEEEIRRVLAEAGEEAEAYTILPHRGGELEAAQLAVDMVREGRADIPMKGLMQTSSFMRAILDKDRGLLPEGALLSQATIFAFTDPDTGGDRLMIVTDCAVNIAPDCAAKRRILENSVRLARSLGVETPRVAVVAPLETVNPRIQSTVDAAELAQAGKRGEIAGCLVGGPLALDNAISQSAARHKGIADPVAGHADILLMPDLGAGNIFFKSLVYIAGAKTASALCGTQSPVVMTSRTDTPENKYYSILLAAIGSAGGEN